LSNRNDDGFTPQAFQNPDAHLWPGYFWIWEDRLEIDRLLEQLREMHAMGAKSICVHPIPREFRPDSLPSTMEPDYLTPEFLAVVRQVVEECDRLGMNYWFYDEGGWPSGSAAGRVHAQNEALHALRVLTPETMRLKAGDHLTVPVAAVCACMRGADECHLPGTRLGPFETDRDLTILSVRRPSMVYPMQMRHAAYVDLLHPSTTEAFLQLTHQAYGRTIGEFFGKAVRFAFTDEPACIYTRPPGQLTWTEDLPDEFARRKGYPLVPHLPLLLDETPRHDRAAQIRIDFYDVWSQLFVERYLDPIRNWCAENGLLSSGHFGGEDDFATNAGSGFGHLLRALRALDVPGIDAIWRQIFPGQRNLPFPKYASSSARQKGQPLVFSESFAVYGSGLTPEQMRWITDYQYVRGITMTVLASYPTSMRAPLALWSRQNAGPEKPLWKYMDIYHAYTARLGYLLSLGEPACNVAVYYDARSVWAGGRDRERAAQLHVDISRTLLENQIEFDYVDDDALAGPAGTVRDGALVVGAMRYQHLIVPETRWLPPACLSALAAFVAGGGVLIAVGGLPSAEGGERALEIPEDQRSRLLRIDVGDLGAHLGPLVTLARPQPDLRVTKRQWPGGAVYFFTNEADHEVEAQVTVRESGVAAACDLVSGRLEALACTAEDGRQAFSLRLAPLGSQAILFGADSVRARADISIRERIPLDQEWRLQARRRCCLGANGYESSACQDETLRVRHLGDWRDMLGAHFSGDAVYTTRVHLHADQAERVALLDLGEVRYACEVRVNGTACGRLLWRPFVINVQGHLRAGQNEISVLVTNTMANAVSDPEARQRWQPRGDAGQPAPLDPYDQRVTPMEQESLPSGLYGPVCLLLGT